MTTGNHNQDVQPPAAARWLLKKLVPGQLGLQVLRDLDEEFERRIEEGKSSGAARSWYWRQIAAVDTLKLRRHARQQATDGGASDGWHLRELGAEVRYAARGLLKSPAFSLVIVLTLALGIGANAAIFSVVNNVVLRPLPYTDGNALVRLNQDDQQRNRTQIGISPLELADYRERSEALTDLVEYHTMFFNLLSRGEPERVQVGVASWDFFDVLGIEPIHGRSFTSDEDHIGDEPVLILGYDYWVRRFGADPEVVGTAVEMNNMTHTIVGVLPPIPTYPNQNDVWMPWYACPFRSGENWDQNRNARGLTVIGRLASQATPEAAASDANRVLQQMAQDHGAETYPEPAGWDATITPLRDELTAQARPTFFILLAMSGLVLIIAGANVANLALARASRREHDFAVRTALGAGRGRIVRHLMAESVLLALAGGVLGVVMAFFVVDVLATFASGFSPRANEVGVDGWIVLFTLAVALATGLGVGAFTSVFTRSSASGLSSGAGKQTEAGNKLRARGALVVAQVALAFSLVAGAGLMIKSFAQLLRVNPGFSTENVLAMTIDLDWNTYTTGAESREFFDRLLERTRQHPQVLAAGVASDYPLSTQGFAAQRSMILEGGSDRFDEGDGPVISTRAATDGYFEALRIPLLRGRTLNDLDHAEAPQVVVLSQSAAERYYGSDDPVGRRVQFDRPVRQSEDPWFTVVGVVGDVKQAGLDQDFQAEVYFSYAQTGFARRLLVRSMGDPAAMIRTLTDDVYSVDPRQPVSFVQTLEEAQRDSLASPRTLTILMGLFGSIALLIAAAGILGVIAFAVSRRTHEIGIRMALGAKQDSVLWMVLKQALLLSGTGLLVGMAGALLVGRLLEGYLFDVPAADPLTMAGTALLLVGVAALAAYVPARRAASIDPASAFRVE